MERWRVKQVVNWLNLSTLLGLGIAVFTSGPITKGPRGILISGGYRLGIPKGARAFTVGNVILTRLTPEELQSRESLFKHEERHTWQYVAFIGLPMIPLYGLAAVWSYLRSRNGWEHNIFEIWAGLREGGYTD